MDSTDTALGELKRRRFYWPSALLAFLCACGHFRALSPFQDPLSAEEHLKLGDSYDQQGLRKESIGQYRTAVRLDPSSEAGWMALGNGEFNEGNLAAAQKAYERVLKLAPSHAGANNNLAMVYLAGNERLSEAEERAKTALRQGGPLRPYILDTLANIYIRGKRYAEAREALDTAQAGSPAGDPSFQERLRLTRRGMEEALAKK